MVLQRGARGVVSSCTECVGEAPLPEWRDPTCRIFVSAMRSDFFERDLAPFAARINHLGLILVLIGLPIGSATAQDQAICPATTLECCQTLQVPASPQPAPPGFGVHIWPSTQLLSPNDLSLLRALHPTHLRVSVGVNWRRTAGLLPSMSDADLDRYVQSAYEAVPSIQESLHVLQTIKQRTNADLDLIVWEPPRLPGESDSSQWRSLATVNVTLAARFHVANLKYLAERGVPIGTVELSNEPDGTWNIKIAPTDYRAMVEKIRTEATRRQVTLPRILGPGVSTGGDSLKYLAAPGMGSAIGKAVDILSLHMWDDKANRDHLSALHHFLESLSALKISREVWVSELGLAKPFLERNDAEMNAGNRVPNNIAMTQAYAVLTARDLLRTYGEGVGTVIYWEFRDQSWGRGLVGLLSIDGTPKPVYREIQRVAEQIALTSPIAILQDTTGHAAILVGAHSQYLFAWNTQDRPVALKFLNPHYRLESAKATISQFSFAGSCGDKDGDTLIDMPPQSLVGVPLHAAR
jgi:hypothetical protein